MGMSETTKFLAEVIELEVERVKYMLKSYLRARKCKVRTE